MVATIDRDADRDQRHQLIVTTRGIYVATAAAFNGGEAWENMQDWLEAVGRDPDEHGEGELPYELDPNARPDANFMAMMVQTQQDGGGMGVERVKAEQITGPFADRLREVIAEKAAAN